MKQPASITANYYAHLDPEGELSPQAEIALVLAEPQYRVDAGGEMIRESVTETIRFAASPALLRQVAEKLQGFAEQLESDFAKSQKS